jgi:hypothetical protein
VVVAHQPTMRTLNLQLIDQAKPLSNANRERHVGQNPDRTYPASMPKAR